MNRDIENRPRIIAFMNAYSQGKSGGDMVFIEVANRLKDFDKLVVTSSLGRKLCEEESLSGNFLITSREKRFGNVIFTYLRRTIRALFFASRLKAREGDVLLASSDFLPDVLPVFLLKMRNGKIPWVQHIFHLIPRERKIPFLAQCPSFLFIRGGADLITVDNNLLREDLIKMGFEPAKIFVNYPGIRLDYLRKARAGERGYEGIFMAQLRSSKGIFDLPRIWRRVGKELPKARLGIIGKGRSEVLEKLKALIKEEGVEENVDILGYLSDDEAFSTIKASKIFVFPSHEEGFGIAPLEAQALGLPVVAWDLSIFEEIFPRGMRKVEQDNLDTFSGSVLKLLSQPEEYEGLSRGAEENASRFNWDETARRELELIENLR